MFNDLFLIFTTDFPTKFPLIQNQSGMVAACVSNAVISLSVAVFVYFYWSDRNSFYQDKYITSVSKATIIKFSVIAVYFLIMMSTYFVNTFEYTAMSLYAQYFIYASMINLLKKTTGIEYSSTKYHVANVLSYAAAIYVYKTESYFISGKYGEFISVTIFSSVTCVLAMFEGMLLTIRTKKVWLGILSLLISASTIIHSLKRLEPDTQVMGYLYPMVYFIGYFLFISREHSAHYRELISENTHHFTTIRTLTHDFQKRAARLAKATSFLGQKLNDKEVRAEEIEDVKKLISDVRNFSESLYDTFDEALRTESSARKVGYENLTAVTIREIKTHVKDYCSSRDNETLSRFIFTQDDKMIDENHVMLPWGRFTINLLDNVLDNAIKFSPIDSAIYFDLSVDTSRLRINVTNSLSGIDAVRVEKAYEGFEVGKSEIKGVSSRGHGILNMLNNAEKLQCEVGCELVDGKLTVSITANTGMVKFYNDNIGALKTSQDRV